MNALLVLADANIAARHDPTWMYSTLAQTAGALVGLLGAVLISRVISHMAALQPHIADIRQRIHRVLEMAACNRSTIVPRLNESSFGPEGMAWYALIDERHQKLQQLLVGGVRRERLSCYVKLLRECVSAYPASANASLGSNDMRQPIEGNISHLELLRDKLAELDAQLVPKSLWIVFLLLAFLSLVGVAWPLVELAVLTDETSWRMSALMVAFAVGVLALMGYFFYLLGELRGLGRFQWKAVA